jgi:hypothetical protein
VTDVGANPILSFARPYHRPVEITDQRPGSAKHRAIIIDRMGEQSIVQSARVIALIIRCPHGGGAEVAIVLTDNDSVVADVGRLSAAEIRVLTIGDDKCISVGMTTGRKIKPDDLIMRVDALAVGI